MSENREYPISVESMEWVIKSTAGVWGMTMTVDQVQEMATTLEECGHCKLLSVHRCPSVNGLKEMFYFRFRFNRHNDEMLLTVATLAAYSDHARKGNLGL
jgi:hypothetical protein